jgi:hypothetical protein
MEGSRKLWKAMDLVLLVACTLWYDKKVFLLACEM